MNTVIFTFILIVIVYRGIYKIRLNYKNKGCHNCSITDQCNKKKCSNPLEQYYKDKE